jgi:hypothetical protein
MTNSFWGGMLRILSGCRKRTVGAHGLARTGPKDVWRQAGTVHMDGWNTDADTLEGFEVEHPGSTSVFLRFV